MDIRFGEVNDRWKNDKEVQRWLQHLAHFIMNGTLEETNEYWKKEDEEMRNSKIAQACGDNPRWLNLDTISIEHKDDTYIVSYYDPFWKVTQRVSKNKSWGEFWGETLEQAIKNYDPNGRFEAYAYHRILCIIGYCFGAANVKPDLPEIDRTTVPNIWKGIEKMWASMEPQLYPKWPQTTVSMWPRVWHLPKLTKEEYQTLKFESELRKMSENDYNNRRYNIDFIPVADAITLPQCMPVMGRRVVSIKEETVAEPGYDTPITKVTTDYETYLKFETEEALDEFVAKSHIPLGKVIKKDIFSIQRMFAHWEYDEEEDKSYLVKSLKTILKKAPRVYKKTDNTELTIARDRKVTYRAEPEKNQSLFAKYKKQGLPPILWNILAEDIRKDRRFDVDYIKIELNKNGSYLIKYFDYQEQDWVFKTTDESWGEYLAEAIENYDPEGSFEIEKYDEIADIINNHCEPLT